MMVVHSKCIANAHAGSAAFEVRAAEAATGPRIPGRAKQTKGAKQERLEVVGRGEGGGGG